MLSDLPPIEPFVGSALNILEDIAPTSAFNIINIVKNAILNNELEYAVNVVIDVCIFISVSAVVFLLLSL